MINSGQIFYRGGTPILNGNLAAPAGVMSRGVCVVESSGSVALAATTERPLGFLQSEVVLEVDYQELLRIPESVMFEVPVSGGDSKIKVQVLEFQDGTNYVAYGADVIDGSTTFAKDDVVYAIAGGKIANLANAASGDKALGRVTEIGVVVEDTAGGVAWKAESTLAAKP
jgi:hypothetical protein